MRRYGLYDTTRGVTIAVSAGIAGLLLWTAALVGTHSVGRFWAAMAIVAAAGLVVSLSQVLGGWTKGLRLRVSLGTLAVAFAPVLVCVAWILLATQPGHGWEEGTIASWSGSVGLLGVIDHLALWHGVLAFGLGLVLGLSFDTLPVAAAAAVEPPAATGGVDEPVTAERREVEPGAVEPLGRAPVH